MRGGEFYMRAENIRMKNWLKQNGVKCSPKYLWNGSLKGTWRLDDYKRKDGQIISTKWWGNKELQNKLIKLGFVDFDGKPISDYCGNGGEFSVFLRLNDKYAEMQLLYGTDDCSAIY